METKTRAPLSIKDIVQFELPAIFKRHHLNRDVVIGIIGDRGDGKSLGGSVIVLLDYMVEDEPCWSNMAIKVGFDIDDATAGRYGMQGGTATFASEKLVLPELLSYHPRYKGGVIFVDEINIALADARRAMANQNLAATDLGQQLRKLQSAMVYTCIHEMFVDSRIRDLTDIFINSRDTAISPSGLSQKKKPGIDFEWTIFPMTRKLTGLCYKDTGKTLPPVYLHGQPFWGTIDTLERQERTKIKMGKDMTANIEFTESPQVLEARSKWGWLYDKLLGLHQMGRGEIGAAELWHYLEVDKRGLSTKMVGQQLGAMGITKRQGARGHYIYIIDNFDLNSLPKDRNELVLVH